MSSYSASAIAFNRLSNYDSQRQWAYYSDELFTVIKDIQHDIRAGFFTDPADKAELMRLAAALESVRSIAEQNFSFRKNKAERGLDFQNVQADF